METVSFSRRLKVAGCVLLDAASAGQVEAGSRAPEAKPTEPVLPPERVHASGLMVLAAL